MPNEGALLIAASPEASDLLQLVRATVVAILDPVFA
jgi:hypothetical protein